jgi:hypothetical protein
MDFKKTRLASWVEWKLECALAECSPDVQSDIQDWAVPILCNAERKNGVPEGELEERGKRRSNGVSDIWWDLEHRMEGKFSERKYKKRWKDVICDNIDDLPDDDEKRRDSFEAQIQIRILERKTDELRKILEERKNISHSLDEPVSREPGAATFKDTYKGKEAAEFTPAAEVVWRELCELAEKEAKAVCSGFSLRECFALGCKSEKIPLYLPEVVKAANCGKTQLNEAFNTAAQKFEVAFDEMRVKYAKDSASEDWELFSNRFMQIFLDYCREVVPPEILRLGGS